MILIQYIIRCFFHQDNMQQMTADKGENLLAVLRKHHIPLEAACSGKGICGKCLVQVMQGDVPATETERRVLSAQELENGYRLACKTVVRGPMTIRIQSGYTHIQTPETKQTGRDIFYGSDKITCDIAVDLGSTTLAAELIDTEGNILAQTAAVNSQRSYGADVLSRMQASKEGAREQLRACICRDLEQMFRTLIGRIGARVRIARIAVAGNTVMLHLLRGYSCEKLGQAPFEPVNLEQECLEYQEVFEEAQEVNGNVPECSGSKVFLLPGMSAFLGADITAGLYSSGFWQTPVRQPAFFLDLGTNGEMAFGSRDGFVTASTAAGPAFEGGRLSSGVPGIPGAICRVSYLYHRVRVQTIGQKKPCGICGTGAMEAAAALLQEGLMNADGLLAPELFETGMLLARREDGSSILLTQADIREIQMAKAAIRAGIEVLRKEYYGQPERVYLAGGFGYYLSADTAVSIGLFPPEWEDRIVLCKNTSLKGAAAFLTDPSCAQELEKIRGKNRGIRLEGDPVFQDVYVREMRFPDTG